MVEEVRERQILEERKKQSLGERFGDWGKDLGERLDDYFHSTRSGRLTSSAFSIAWSLVAFTFFMFFSRYIAYYEYVADSSSPGWVRIPVLTGDYNAWLPLLGVTLGLNIVGHIILIVFDRSYYGTSLLRQGVILVVNLFGLATLLTLLNLFPFDFSAIPNTAVAEAVPVVVAVALIGLAIGLVIATIVHFVRLVVAVAR